MTSHVSNSDPFVGVSHRSSQEEIKRHSQESRNWRLRQPFRRPTHESLLLLKTVCFTHGIRLFFDKVIQKLDTTLKIESC